MSQSNKFNKELNHKKERLLNHDKNNVFIYIHIIKINYLACKQSQSCYFASSIS
jgi:hypothetical protein